MSFNPPPLKKKKRDEKKRVLFCATVDFHFTKFHLTTLKWFQEQGWEVHVAAYGNIEIPFVDVRHHLIIDRSPFRTTNIKGFIQLQEIIKDFQFQLIHCHTPMGGVLTRLAARKARKQGSRVLYTAHGFHFCKGSPIKNWLVYYPIEKWLSHYTDGLITINEEDYHLAKEKQFQVGEIFKVNGVGVDTSVYIPITEKEKQFLRMSFGFQSKDVLLFYAAEFNANKNQQLLIKTVAELKTDFPNLRLLLAGSGGLMESCQELADQLGVSNQIHFLGYQNDVLPYLHLSDLAVASSLREGLPVNIMEAMSCGLPIVALDNRGHRELVENGKNGYLIPRQDEKLFALNLFDLIQSNEMRQEMGTESRRVMEKFSLEAVRIQLNQIYSRYMVEDKDETQSQYHRAYL